MIPKTIHYCWFGGKRKPEEAIRCINSWKRELPDYEIVEWNETNFDLSVCRYVEEAYKQKKWAFVSDYVRFYTIYNNGGIYLDTDVEVLKPIDDIIKGGPYMGREPYRLGGKVASGLGIAAEAGNKLYKEILDSYNRDRFINEDGSENHLTVVDRVTDILSAHGFRIDESPEEVQVVEGIRIYPSEYFCPLGWDGVEEYTENSYTVHLYNASWFSKTDRALLHYSMRMKQAGKLEKTGLRIIIKMLQMFKKVLNDK